MVTLHTGRRRIPVKLLDIFSSSNFKTKTETARDLCKQATHSACVCEFVRVRECECVCVVLIQV